MVMDSQCHFQFPLERHESPPLPRPWTAATRVWCFGGLPSCSPTAAPGLNIGCPAAVGAWNPLKGRKHVEYRLWREAVGTCASDHWPAIAPAAQRTQAAGTRWRTATSAPSGLDASSDDELT